MEEGEIMPLLLPEEYRYPLPKLHRIRQKFPTEKLSQEDIPRTIHDAFARGEIREKMKPGARIAIAVGSRGIQHLAMIVRAVIDECRMAGTNPFIVSAMGSHGEGTEQGQRAILASYGITEEALGVPVITKVETVELGRLPDGTHVYFDRAAYEADLIVPVNRVKLHTDFIGELQSGIAKMLVIGLGNQKGCTEIHGEPGNMFSHTLEAAARLILAKAPVGFGVAILENAYDETAEIHVLPKETLIEQEKELVRRSISYFPSLRFPSIDVLIMQEIGKDVSGAGFDPNIVGRSTAREEYLVPIPEIKRMVLLDVTAASHGNGIGIGLFDVVTKNILPKLDLAAMYANAIACRCVEDARIPLQARDEDEAVRIALKLCRGVTPDAAKIVRIKNTLSLGEVEVSDVLLPVVDGDDRLERADDEPQTSRE